VVGHNVHTSFCSEETIGLCFGLMHPRRLWILPAVLAAFAGQAAVIYKWTDPSGLVHYSDQPVPGAEKIITSGSSLNGMVSAGREAAAGATNVQKPSVPATGYSRFDITSPAPDQSFFGDEAIGVHLALEPDLKPDQSITWHLNGKELADQGPSATQFTLAHLDRGTYVIAATITDQKTGSSQTTDSVNFFVRQPSELAPQHK
jgi:hypothetical protein